MDEYLAALEARGVGIARELQALAQTQTRLRREAAQLQRLLALARGQPLPGATEAVRAVLREADGPLARSAIADAVRISRDHANMILGRLKRRGEARNDPYHGWIWTGED